MSSFLPIDFTKSIQKQKLVYKSNSKSLFDYILFYVVIVIIAFASVVMIYSSIFTNNTNYVIIIITVLVDTWITTNVVMLNHFVIVEGKDREQNKQDTIKVLIDLGLTENLNTTQANMVRDFNSTTLMSSGRVITCLFSNEKVYINITSLLRGDGLSMFGGFFNYFICKNIARQFKKVQASH